MRLLADTEDKIREENIKEEKTRREEENIENIDNIDSNVQWSRVDATHGDR